MKKVLIVMPNPSLPPRGADENNRYGIIRIFQELGYAVTIITKSQTPERSLDEIGQQYNVSIVQFPYKSKKIKTPSYYIKRLLNPYRWDGAADEYFDEGFISLISQWCAVHVPAAVFIEYTFLWPAVYALGGFKGRIIVRSHNFEPAHFLSEDGVSVVNLCKFLAKMITEYKAGRVADTLFAITLTEARYYKLCGARNVRALHSGYLPFLLEKPVHIVNDNPLPLKLLFMGASYNIAHNRRAVEFLLEQVMPTLELECPGVFELLITGGKLPQHIEKKMNQSIKYLGYIDNLEKLLPLVDAAVIPHIAGHGMQLKTFEPLVRGIPTVTFRGLLGGYAIEDGKEVMIAENTYQFVESIKALRDLALRRCLSHNARVKATQLFNKLSTKSVLEEALV